MTDLIPSPCFVLDIARPRTNLEIAQRVGAAPVCKMLATKADVAKT